MNTVLVTVLFTLLVQLSVGYRILMLYPSYGKSHNIFFNALAEELINNHEVTVVNYYPMEKHRNLRHINVNPKDKYDDIDMEDFLNQINTGVLKDFQITAFTTQEFYNMSNENCQALISNKKVQDIVLNRESFDVVLVEQFVSDCGLSIAYKLGAPTIGMTSHVMMPYSYERLGAPNHPAFVPNHFFGSGSNPGLWSRLKSLVINTWFCLYYRHVIQKNDHEIISKVYSGIPDLEDLSRNMSLMMVNQYYPITGSRLFGANVVEIGGLHVTEKSTILMDNEVKKFLDSATFGAVYISFGSVARNFPRSFLEYFIKLIEKNPKMHFIWKIDATDIQNIPNNVLVRKWLPQTAILCHEKVKAFVSHSGMLSTSEAVHCGTPMISIPLFGDQFANSVSAVSKGFAVFVDIITATEKELSEALDTVVQTQFQARAKELSAQWKDRPLSAMDTAVFWTEYIARHKGTVDMRPPTVDLPFYKYAMLDMIFILLVVLTITFKTVKSILSVLAKLFNREKKNKIEKKQKKTKTK